MEEVERNVILPRVPPESEEPFERRAGFGDLDIPGDDQESLPEIEHSDPLQDLRDLIVNEESENIRDILEMLDYLRSKIDDPEGVIRTVKPIIGEVIAERIAESPDEMAKALGPMVAEALHRQIRENRARAARIIAPVIFRAMAQATLGRIGRSLQAVGRTLEEIFWFPLRRRVRDALPPPGSLPQVHANPQRATPFALREIFILGRDSGLLFAHATWDPSLPHARTDSRFLPALRKFLKTSLEEGDEVEFLKARFEQYTVLVEVGPYAHLVAVVVGGVPVGFQPDMRQTLSDIHAEFQTQLKCARMAPEGLVGVRPILRVFLDRYRPDGVLPKEVSSSDEVREYDPIRFPAPHPNHAGRY